MKLLIEDAELERIRQCIESYPIDGVSVGAALDIDELKRIRELLGEDRELHVPIDFLRADRLIERLGLNTYVKIPVGTEGFKAMQQLNSSAISFVAVDVRTPMQALVACNCGATYVMPYVNNLDSRNAVEIVKDMSDALKRNALDAEVIAARFKNSRQAIELCEYGIGAVVVSADMLSSMLND